MSWVWILLAVLLIVATLRYRRGLDARKRGGGPVVDDDAVRRILEHGRIETPDDEDDEPLDLDAIAREEEEFWKESWDEPEEYGR